MGKVKIRLPQDATALCALSNNNLRDGDEIQGDWIYRAGGTKVPLMRRVTGGLLMKSALMKDPKALEARIYPLRKKVLDILNDPETKDAKRYRRRLGVFNTLLFWILESLTLWNLDVSRQSHEHIILRINGRNYLMAPNHGHMTYRWSLAGLVEELTVVGEV